jgi:calcineurin-like phosphoesterase
MEQGIPWTVVSAQGREEMYPIDCPFQTLDSLLKDPALRLKGEAQENPEKLPGGFILVDFHAEAPQEKEALAFYLDGRITALVGTHTHVQTADERIFPQGTAYTTDLGMTGVTTGIIGMDTAICVNRNKTQIPIRMEGAQGPVAIQGVAITLDDTTGKALAIERINRSPMNA